MIGAARRSGSARYTLDARNPPDEPLLEWCRISQASPGPATSASPRRRRRERPARRALLHRLEAPAGLGRGRGLRRRLVPARLTLPGPDSEPVILPVGAELLEVVYPGQGRLPRARRGPGDGDGAGRRSGLGGAAPIDQKAAHRRCWPTTCAVLWRRARRRSWREAVRGGPVRRPATFRFGPMEGGGSSAYGDLVWTYARGPGPATASCGRPLCRLWQRQEAGWKIVLAQLIPAPAAIDPPLPGA